MWGQVKFRLNFRARSRIIPTRVGTRNFIIKLRQHYWDHPHACGDKIALLIYTAASDGSSPRVWGQESSTIFVVFTPRIIPTRVGTSRYPLVLLSIHRDHPHACGDKSAYPSIMLQYKGSSPRVWEQEALIKSFMPLDRIIPTRVGTSWEQLATWDQSKDHPHACGDKNYQQAI